jgi:hypothetical protein
VVQQTRVNLFTAILMQISVSHPAIYRFIEILKDIQLNTYIKINSDDLPVTCTNLKYKKRVEYR